MRVQKLAREVFSTDAAVAQWLTTPDAALGKRPPLAMLSTDVGTAQVHNLLAGDDPRRSAVKAFRIVLRRYGATARSAFSGASGYATDGRWHSKGRYLDYAAESQSLAVLSDWYTTSASMAFTRISCMSSRCLIP